MHNAIIILAAGKGTRMHSDLPKVLHEVAGVPLLTHIMHTSAKLTPKRTIIVTGHGALHVEKNAKNYNSKIEFIRQEQQNGTGHAVAQTANALTDFDGNIFILYGDTPFITSNTLLKMAEKRTQGAPIVVLGFKASDPTGYGRLICNANGTLDSIIEEKDANAQERAINLCNSGVMCISRSLLFDLINQLSNNNANNEYYLTDIVAIARARALETVVVECNQSETLGVNSRADLAQAEHYFQETARQSAMKNGVTLRDPATTYFSFNTIIEPDVVIEQHVIMGLDTTIKRGAIIRAYSHLEGAYVAQNCIIGPYARLRPGTRVNNDARIGNFVEIKNTTLGENVKVNHLSYIGDTTIGDETNIGAGTITCNYDGVFKHHTHIGKRVFIGSNTALVAPVHVGDDAMTGSGSVITKDIEDGALAISRARQENKKGFALRMINKLKAAKAALKKV